jgi:hypothetical protein
VKVLVTWGRASVIFVALGVGAAIYYFTGDACKSSARIDALYAVPLLFGVAAFLIATRSGPRWWLGIASGIATAVVSAGVVFILALIHWGAAGCYT